MDQLWGLDRRASLNPATGARAWYGYVTTQRVPGTARQLLNDAGHVTASANYDPYGTPEGAALPSPFGYTGELTDPATGSQYLRARWYRPGQGSLLGVDPLLAQTGQAYSYANDNPVNGSDPSGLFDPCNLAPLQPFCQGVGSEIRNAVGGVVGYWDHLTGRVEDYVRRTLVSALFGANGLLVKAAQSDFAAGVNDGVVDFARGLAGVPGTVKDHLDTLNYYDQHPRDKPPLLQGLVFRALKENLSQNPTVQLIQGEVQLLKGLWDVVQGLRKALACGAVARGLGHALATLVLNAAVAELGGRFVGALSDTLRGDEVVAARAEGDTNTVRDLGGCTNGCFPAGTRVATPGGSAPIDGLHVGDTVLAEDTITGTVEPRRVEAVIADGVQPLLALDLADGSRLSATPNHLFYVDGGPGIARPEWLAAGDLQAGDRLRTRDAKDTTVLRVRYHTGYARVYTLTVAADHDFFVGPDAVLVHNCDGILVDKPEDDPLYWEEGNPSVAQYVVDVARAVVKNGLKPLKGYYSRTYENRNTAVKGSGKYIEQDLYPSAEGGGEGDRRNDERLIIDLESGHIWYNKLHYKPYHLVEVTKLL